MVSTKVIRASNALLDNAKTPFVAVFVGGTSGIGMATIEALVATGATSKIYLVGRKSSRQPMEDFQKHLKATNPRANIIWSEAEITLLAETKRVCRDIAGTESHVDLLFMSAGYAPFSGRKETTEGIEITQSLEYYSRILFAHLLLPLLRCAAAGRIVSVLAGGLEPPSIALDDLDLRNPSNFGGFAAQRHYAAMGTLMMENMAKEVPRVTFIHSFPGWVKTGNYRRGAEAGTWLARLVWPVSGPLIDLMSLDVDESGRRHLFQSTSSFFGGRGISLACDSGEVSVNTAGGTEGGLFLLDQDCKCTQNAKALRELRTNALDKVLGHTEKVLQPYLNGRDDLKG